ncbi:MAG: 60S ribosomal export protein NMD3 [Thermoplasmata archaeon]
MTYCVECGKEGKTYDNLCLECFDKKHKLVEVPENIDITLCAHCGAHQRGASWVHEERDDAIRFAIEQVVEVDKLARLEDIDISLREEDERNLSTELSFELRVEDAVFERQRRTRIRLKRGVCDVCSRQKGEYFEAILQVRPPEGEVEDDLIERASETIHLEVERMGPEVFISKEESVHGGLDFYLSSKAAGKAIAKLLQSTFGGNVTSSATLQGRRDGRDFYRITYLFRFPPYSKGLVLKIADKLFQVISVGPPFVIADLISLEERSVPASDLKSARKADAEILSAIIVSRSEKEVQVIDPETMKTITLLRPPGIEEDAEEMKIVKSPEGIYPSYLQSIN